jgi:ankyrin repeat protein
MPYFPATVANRLLPAVWIFIKVDASVTDVDSRGWTALHYCAAAHEAAAQIIHSIARLLIEAGADISVGSLSHTI